MSEFEVKLLEQLRAIEDAINNSNDEICAEIVALRDKEQQSKQQSVNEERWD